MMRKREDWFCISNATVMYDSPIEWMTISRIGVIITSERNPTMHNQILAAIYTGRITAMACLFMSLSRSVTST